ncbi:hypothetical protein ACHHYP_09465 [Achlya hypogyna]|uniref:UDENN domain-containing protein n=1 Tax=Achlya hypogyna TaxID=1202772 RepID=A0A1V9YN94_ACHHY|nr:hypothetical protein ACHHYP_09465 [Achlya hypogyna]
MASPDMPELVEYFFVGVKTGVHEKLTFQYPTEGRAEDEYPANILMFMFPFTTSPLNGGVLPPPVYNTFVLTTSSGAALHGTSLCFHALSLPHDTAPMLTSLCFVSKWPFCVPFLKYLEQLAILGVHQGRQPPYIGVEKSLNNLFHEVPLPVRGHAGVIASIGDTDVLFKRYTMQDVPFEMDMEFLEYTFALLDASTLLHVLFHMLLEHSVLIVGVDSLFVTAVADTLRHLIFPLHWDHVFIPVVPPGVDMATLLDAPVPFLAGAHPLQLDGAVLPPSIVRVDVFEGRLTTAVDLPPLPDAAVALRERLEAVQKKNAPQLGRRLWERRVALQKALYSNNKGDLTYERGKLLCGSSALLRKITKSFTGMLGNLLVGHEHCCRGDVASYVRLKPAHQQAFFTAFADTNAFQSFLDAASSSDIRFVLEQQGASKSPLLSPQGLFCHAMAPDVPPLDAANDAPELQLRVMFPTLDVAAFGTPRARPFDDAIQLDDLDMPSRALVTTPESRATVFEWLDTWLSTSEKARVMQSVFRRSRTIGSQSPERSTASLSRTQSQSATKTSTSSPSRPWLKTPCSPFCTSKVTLRTIALEESLRSKAVDAIDQAYVDLIKVLGGCPSPHHVHDVRHVFTACLRAGPALGDIRNVAPYWRPFSQMLHELLKRGQVHEAVKWFSQVAAAKPAAPAAYGDAAPATVLEHELESLLFRIYATFSVGSLGLRLNPYGADNKGAQVSGFYDSASGPRQVRELDVIESINGRAMLNEPFPAVVRSLMDAPRPVTITLLRGMPAVEKLRSEPTPRLRPRRFVNDKFGWLHREGIRVTLLSDCTDCGHRLSHDELEQQQARATCPTCGSGVQPHFCVLHHDVPSEPYAYLSWPEMKERLEVFRGSSLTALLALDPLTYWNLFLKSLALDVDLREIFPMVSSPAPEEPPVAAASDLHALCEYVLRQASEPAMRQVAVRLLEELSVDNNNPADDPHKDDGSQATSSDDDSGPVSPRASHIATS